MPISLVDLQLVEPTQRARRLFWHVLSIGCVTRDEPERHPGLDKAGVFAFHILSGTGRLRIGNTEYALQPSDRCWLLDLLAARIAEGRDRPAEKVLIDGTLIVRGSVRTK